MNMKLKYKDYKWAGLDFILTVDHAVVDSHTKICTGFNSWFWAR